MMGRYIHGIVKIWTLLNMQKNYIVSICKILFLIKLYKLFIMILMIIKRIIFNNLYSITQIVILVMFNIMVI